MSERTNNQLLRDLAAAVVVILFVTAVGALVAQVGWM
jgi:hypothetical protein